MYAYAACRIISKLTLWMVWYNRLSTASIPPTSCTPYGKGEQLPTASFYLAVINKTVKNTYTCTSADLLEDLDAGFQRFRPGFLGFILRVSSGCHYIWLTASHAPVTYINQHISAGLAPD